MDGCKEFELDLEYLHPSYSFLLPSGIMMGAEQAQQRSSTAKASFGKRILLPRKLTPLGAILLSHHVITRLPPPTSLFSQLQGTSLVACKYSNYSTCLTIRDGFVWLSRFPIPLL